MPYLHPKKTRLRLQATLKQAPRKAVFMFCTGLFLLVVFGTISAFADFIAPFDPTQLLVGGSLSPPDSSHLMGTTKLGYDVFSRVVYGGRVSISIGLLSSFMALLVGFPLGLVSGLSGGKLDRGMVLIMDSIYSFPGMMLALIITAVLGPGMLNAAIAVFAVFAPQYYRVTRNETLVIKQKTFVESAIASGASYMHILRYHIARNVCSSVPALFSTSTAWGILVLAGLSYLGLGITPPRPSLGYDLSVAQTYLPNGNWWLALFPGLFIVGIIASFAFLAEGLNEMRN